MPEFHLDHGTPEAARTFASLASFTQGYIEAMFFTSTSDPDDGDLDGATFAELAPESLAKIIADCEAFQAGLPRDSLGRSLLDLAYDYAPVEYDEERAGNDYWYTRNGHGTGFWDRGLGEVGEALATAARYSTVDLYRGDDGQIYLS